MAANGHTLDSSVILSAPRLGFAASSSCTSLGFDRNRGLFLWDGTVDELQEFCMDKLKLLELKMSNSERCTSLKTKGVTFTLYPSTKTLQVQGTDQKEVKRKLQAFLPTDKRQQSENSDPEGDVKTFVCSTQSDKDVLTMGNVEDVAQEIIDLNGAASPVLQYHSCKGCTALKLELQSLKLEVEELKRQIIYSNDSVGQPCESNKPYQAAIIRLQESNNSLIDTVQVLANLLSEQSCNSGKVFLSPNESQEKITRETFDHNNSSSQQCDIPWETVISKSNKNKKRSKKHDKGPQGDGARETQQSNSPSAEKRPKTVILGDSMLKFVNGNRVSKTLEKKVYVRSFPGAHVAHMKHYVVPALEELNPEEVILHIGTNNLRDQGSQEVAEAIVNLANEVVAMKPDINITISEIVTRGDNKDLDSKGKSVNKIVRRFCRQNSWKTIPHNNILEKHLNPGGLHLSREGNSLFTQNFISYFRN